jgi:anaerobic glycerol-3-phosphate dehydrogenase
MIVIAKLEGTRTATLKMAEVLAQAATENDVDEIEIPDPDLLKNEAPIEVVQCQVKIQKLIALNNLDMTVYHYLY